MKTTQASVDILKRAMKPEGFNIGINIGKAAGAGIPSICISRSCRAGRRYELLTVFDETRVVPQLLEGPMRSCARILRNF